MAAPTVIWALCSKSDGDLSVAHMAVPSLSACLPLPLSFFVCPRGCLAKMCNSIVARSVRSVGVVVVVAIAVGAHSRN